MNERAPLTALAVVSVGLAASLSLTAATTARGLLATPAPWWGTSHLTSALLTLASGAGAVGALWHAVSALLALATLPCTTSRAAPHPARRVASRVLTRWGAPLIRHAAAGALAASLGAAPACATETSPAPDDLGWHPSPSATAPQDAAPGTAQIPPQEDGAAPEGLPTHTVTPGESLWSIAADHLPPGSSAAAVTSAWPALYEANRSTVGTDPTTLLPGTVLVMPWDTSHTDHPGTAAS